MMHDLRRPLCGVLSASALTLLVHYALAAPEPAATPATPAPDPRELPSYMIPNIPDAADGKKMNWGRSTGPGFMQGIRTFVMDVSSLNLGRENYAAFDPSWGKPMRDDAPAPAPAPAP